MRGNDIQDGQILHRIRIVHRQPMCHASSAIVANQRETLETERDHRRHDVASHAALIVAVARLVGIAVASQVRAHHGEAFEEHRRHFAPHLRRLRIAVQQDHRFSLRPPTQAFKRTGRWARIVCCA
jgi:hypothetical protein